MEIKKSGFTLIEILVATALVGLLGSLAARLITSTFSAYNKSEALNEVQQNGSYLLSVMEQELKNAKDATAVSGGIEIRLLDDTTKRFIFVAPDCAAGHNGYVKDEANNVLTNDDSTRGVNVAAATFTITVPAAGPKNVRVGLALEQACGGPAKAAAAFQTTVVLRGGY